MESIRVRGRFIFEERTPLGALVKRWEVENLVVNTGLAWLAGALSGDVASPETMKYIGIGTGTTAAAATQTALVTEVETRATGTQSRQTTDTASDTYRCVGSITMTANRSITEVGVFSAASAGTMFCRSVFTAEVIASGNVLTVTYECDFDAAA